MRRQDFALIFSLLVTSAACATTFDVGGVQIQLPPPPGFVQTTRDMPAAEGTLALGEDRYNLVLGMFVPKDDGTLDRAAKLSEYTRYTMAKVPNSLVRATISPADFKELAERGTSPAAMADIRAAIEVAEKELQKNAKKYSAYGQTAIALDAPAVYPVHARASHYYAYSMVLSFERNLNGKPTLRRVAATFATAYISGKVVCLYIYSSYDAGGRESALKWTRDTSDAWLKSVVSANARSVRQGSLVASLHASDWKGILRRSLAMGLVGAAFALVGSIVVLTQVIRQRRGRDRDNQ